MRVMIVGQPGSGKSWLASELAGRLGLPLYHMDHIHWQPGWVARPEAEKTALAQEIEAQEAWVFEGNYSPTVAHRVARADLVIWLDLPLGLRLWRVTWRKVTGWGLARPDMAPGCPEGLGPEAWAFYRYIWDTRSTGRARLALVAGLAGPKLRHLTNRRAVARFLRDLGASDK
jgi:adenylate kinase family enzyme